MLAADGILAPARKHRYLRAALPPLDAVLFDLDGTLITVDQTVITREAARLRPLAGRHAATLARWLLLRSEPGGNFIVTVLDRLGAEERTMATMDRLRARRGVMSADAFQLAPGAAEMLRALAERYQLALVTTRSRYHIDQFTTRFPAESALFATTVGLQDARRAKPHPRPVQLAAQRLGVTPDRCLMVGDSPYDVLSALRAGAWSAGVLSGFGSRRQLLRAGAHFVLHNSAELQHVL